MKSKRNKIEKKMKHKNDFSLSVFVFSRRYAVWSRRVTTLSRYYISLTDQISRDCEFVKRYIEHARRLQIK